MERKIVKLQGLPVDTFSFDEAITIQKVFFPEYKLEYLFKHDE